MGCHMGSNHGRYEDQKDSPTSATKPDSYKRPAEIVEAGKKEEDVAVAALIEFTECLKGIYPYLDEDGLSSKAGHYFHEAYQLLVAASNRYRMTALVDGLDSMAALLDGPSETTNIEAVPSFTRETILMPGDPKEANE